MAATAEQAIERLQIVYAVTGADQAQAAGRGVAKAHDEVATSTARATTATAQMERQVNAAVKSYLDNARATQQLAAANDNLERSTRAANDNVRETNFHLHATGIETLNLVNHLKFAALAAYAWSPAFRALVNPAITATIATLGPAAVSAGAAIFRALSPALAFLSKITLPILAIVAAWKLLTSTISQGSDLLEKYGNASRSLDSPNLAANLAKLTTLQPKDDHVTASQAREAAELNTRLDQAKFKLGQALEAQLNLNDAALLLQKIWVNIVEKVAEYAEKATKLGPPDPGLEQLIKDTGYQATGKGDVDERFAAIRDARRRISAQLGSRVTGENDSIGNTFTARWNTAIDALANDKAPKAEKAVAAVASEFDRLEKSMQRAAAVQEAEAKAVDASVGEHARLRAEMRLQEAAQQDIAKHGGSIDDYAERIKKLADRFAEGAQNAAELKLKSDIKFTGDTLFLSDSEKHIASILRQTYGSEWKNMMNGPIAGAIRWNNTLKEIVDTTREIGGEIMKGVVHALMEGKNVGEALSATLKSLSMRLADKAIESLLSGDFAKAAISGISAAVTFIGSKLLDNSGQKALDEAKLKLAGMSDEVRNFNAAADGFELSQFVSAMQQIVKTGMELIKAAMAAGDTAAAIQLIFSGVKQINNQVDQFIKPKGNDTASQIANVNNEAQQIIGELNDLNAKFGLRLNRTAEILGAAADQIAEIQRKAQEEIEKRGRGFDDRLFAATNDNSTLAGQLAAFERDAQRQREQEMIDGGQNILKLQVTLEAERFNIVKDFGDRAIAESKRAAQEQLDAQTRAARGILDFINNLKVGPDSGLSSSARLSFATGTVNATMALAQANNLDALGRITQDVDNELKAARARYGSSSAYQVIEANRIAQLQALPAVVTSSDPVVQALLAVQTNQLGTTAAVEATRQAVLTDTASTVARLDTAIARFVDAVNLLSQSITLLTTSNALLTTSNAVLTAIQGLQSTATAQLNLMQVTLAAGTGAGFEGGNLPNGTPFGSIPAVSNSNMLTALNKIVANTYAISVNTGSNARLIGGRAWGGWINGAGGAHDDGAGLFRMSNREFVVNADATRALTSQFGAGIMDTINAGRLPERTNVIPFPIQNRGSGSGDSSAELRALRDMVRVLTAEVSMLRQENKHGHDKTARRVEQNTEHREETASLSAVNARINARIDARRKAS